MHDGFTHESLVPVHESEFKRINVRVNDLEDLGEKSIEKMAKFEQILLHHTDRINATEEQTRAIFALGTSVEHMVEEVKGLSAKVEKLVSSLSDHEHRIDGIEKINYTVEIDNIKKSLIDLERRPEKKLMQYFDAGIKTAFVAIMMFLVYLFTNGKVGG